MSDLFKKILIATDGSQYSRAAIEKGLDIARAEGSYVDALYVVDTRALAGTDGVPEPTNIYQLLEQEGKRAVEQVKQAGNGLEVETFVLAGHPAAAIVKFANDNDIELIVVGTLGKSGLEELLLGSVADEVIRMAPCPVLVVKGKR